MAPTMPSLRGLCVSTCAVSFCGVFSLARSPVRLALLLLWLLPRQHRRFLLLMLLRLIAMPPRLSMILQLMPMISRCQPIRMPFLPIVMICLLTLSGAMMMLVLLLFSLRVSSLSLLRSSWDLAQLQRCGLISVSAISPLVMLSTYLWCVRSTHFSKVILLLMSSIPSALPSGASLTLFGQLFVEPVVAVRLLGLIWSFSGSMSSYLVSALSLSPDVLTCLLVVVFLSRRCLPSFVLRRPAFALLVCWWSRLCWLLGLLCRLLGSPLHRSSPHLQGGESPCLY